jgi:hypothetical protein
VVGQSAGDEEFVCSWVEHETEDRQRQGGSVSGI